MSGEHIIPSNTKYWGTSDGKTTFAKDHPSFQILFCFVFLTTLQFKVPRKWASHQTPTLFKDYFYFITGAFFLQRCPSIPMAPLVGCCRCCTELPILAVIPLTLWWHKGFADGSTPAHWVHVSRHQADPEVSECIVAEPFVTHQRCIAYTDRNNL